MPYWHTTDSGLRNKIKRLQTSIQLFKKRNIKERSLKNEEKIKQKQLQLKKINEQLKEVLNDALKKFHIEKELIIMEI